MDTPPSPHDSQTVTLSLPPEEQWTLHHVLLDRIEQEPAAAESTRVEPPPVEVFEVFETLEDGQTTFTLAQLDAIQSVLSAYHHSPTWCEQDRPQIEHLLHLVTEPLERHHSTHHVE